MKSYRDAKQHLEKAWEVKKRLFGNSSAEAAQAQADVAELYRVTRREQEAVVAFREAVAVLQAAWGRDDVRFLRILGNYELALRSREEFAEAERVGVWSTRIRVRQALAKGY
jgi:predicted lipid-binding transport protein (Tim44 family)